MRKFMMILMAVALIALPTMAQDQWQSTSALPTSGSSYTPQVTPVGSPAPAMQGSAGAPYTPSVTGGPLRAEDDWGTNHDVDINVDEGSPLGDGLIPLTLLALAYALVVFLRKRKQTLNG